MNAKTKKEIAKLSNMNLGELQIKFAEVIGERTRCPNKKSLIRRITEALHLGTVAAKANNSKEHDAKPHAGRKRGKNGKTTDRQVLPIRMETTVVQKLDAARERLGLKNRTELFRRSLFEYLNEAGETEVANLISEGR